MIKQVHLSLLIASGIAFIALACNAALANKNTKEMDIPSKTKTNV